MRRMLVAVVVVPSALVAVACGGATDGEGPRASGYVEATEVRVATKVAGRVADVQVVEGARVQAGALLVQVSTTDTDLAIQRAIAERAQAEAQWRLVRAGARVEDIELAEAQLSAAQSDQRAAERELQAARDDRQRFEQLLERRAGTTKQRDDAAAREDVAAARVEAGADRVRAARAALDRLRAGARAEEIDAARARVATADAQIAVLEQARADATIRAPGTGVVTARLVEPGELVAPGTPVAVVLDLDRAWVNAYVEEPLVPSLALNGAVTVVTDGGDRLPGTIAFIAPQAEFTPRNVQTAAERARLVYRVKVTVDNRAGILKPGMPVEVELGP